MQFKPPFALRPTEDSRLFFEQNRWRIERVLHLPLSPTSPRRLKQQPKQANIMKFEQNFSLRSHEDRKKFFEQNKWKIEEALQLPLSESTRAVSIPAVEVETEEPFDTTSPADFLAPAFVAIEEATAEEEAPSPESLLEDVVLDEDFNQPEVDFEHLEGEEDAIDINDIDAILAADEEAANDGADFEVDDMEDFSDMDAEEEDGLDMGFDADETEEEEAIEDLADDLSFDDTDGLVIDNNNDGVEDILLDFDDI